MKELSRRKNGTRPATDERGEGGGRGGDDSDRVSRGRRRVETGGRFRWRF